MRNWLTKTRHIVLLGAATVAVFLVSTTPALAWINPRGGGGGEVGGGQAGGGVPEIDPSAAMGAITLLVGGALVLTDRIRYKINGRRE